MALQRLRTSEDKAFGTLAANMFASTTVAHSLHLSITGDGSYSKHKTLGDYYESLPGLLDNVVEGFQGHHLRLLDIPTITPPAIKNIKEFVNHLNSLYLLVDEAQQVTMCSSLKNDLDEVKSLINSTKYKLHFLG